MESLSKEKPGVRLTLGGDLKPGWDDTSRLNSRLESFGQLKHRTHEFVQWALDGGIPLFDRSITQVFRRLRDCGQYLIFRNFIFSKRSRLIGACSCRQHLLCAFCASRRGVKHAVAYKEKVDHLATVTPGSKLMFLTFTIQNGPGLLERFNHLRNAIKTLLRHRNNEAAHHRDHHTEMSKLSGGVFAYEFKRGSGLDLWHPHIHMLALLGPDQFIDAAALKAEWLEITQDSHVINIKNADDNAFLEVFAYALKFSELEHTDRWFASQQLKGERLISSFGDFRFVEPVDDVCDDVLATDEPFVDLLFFWHTQRGYKFNRCLLGSEKAAA